MKKVINLLVVLLIFSSCNFQTQKEENNSKKTEVKDLASKKEKDVLLMTSSGDFEISKKVELYNCDFTIVLNKLKDTTHWSTNDEKFVTPEGFKVGTLFKNLPIEIKNSIKQMSGWGFYAELNSGWQLGFCEGKSCTDHEPKEESKVKWIFKKDR
jgi:hypothetical protein